MTTKERLQQMLEEKGLVVELLWGVEGQWRKTIMDVMRWEANCRDAKGMHVHVGSWETMTECVRRDFALREVEGERWEREVVLLPKKQPPPTFEELCKWAKDYWGLTLTRNDPNNRGYWNACWKSGYCLSGSMPGGRYGHRRFTSLRQLARVLEYPAEKKT